MQGRDSRPPACSAQDDRQGLRGLPERRHRQGYRTRGAGGVPVDRARQALHHQRHGDRPGQDLQPERARHRGRHPGETDPGGRADDLPPALHARDVRDVRGDVARRAVRPRAAHRHPRLGAGEWRRVRGRGRLEARLVLPARPRGHARRGRPRVPCDAPLGRDLRRLDARQDRGRGPRRGRVPEPPLHQLLDEAGGRSLPLRRDAQRGRLRDGRRRRRPPRARPLPRDHHDRRRRPTSSTTWRTFCRPSSRICRSG